MKITATFNYNGKQYTYSRDADLLDRNYSDESYALILEDIPGTDNGLFEVNILKDAEIDGTLQPEGYVAIYEDADDVNPVETVDAEIKFETIKTNLRGQLVLEGWCNGGWHIIDHDANTKEGLERLERTYNAPEYKNMDMRIELFT